MATSSKASQSPVVGTASKMNNGNGLILYHVPFSSYSQKVVFALNEKKVKFQPHILNFSKFEQYEPWFMKINPNGEVPVLKDGVKVIPDSTRILEYLEDNFSNGDTPRLMPEKGSEGAQKVSKMRELLDAVKLPVITLGCVLFPEFTINSNMSAKERTLRQGILLRTSDVADKYADDYPEFQEQYRSKKQKMETLLQTVRDVNQVNKALEDTEEALDTVETELASHTEDKSNWWLCCEKFTVADITLAVILHRLEYLGLWERYFRGGKRPHIVEYYKRISEREAFKATFSTSMPGMLGICCCALKSKYLMGGAVATLLAAAIVGFIIYRRSK